MINFLTHLRLAFFDDPEKWYYYMMGPAPTDNIDT